MATKSKDLNTADTGKSIADLRSARDLQNKLDQLQKARATRENQWKVNMAFYKGQQYTWFNKRANRLESLPTEDGDKPRYRVRLVSNQILVGSMSLLAKLTKTRPQMWATPGSSSDTDVKASQMAERLLEYWWQELNLNQALKEALLWAICCEGGYWKITWDKDAGKAMRFTLGPDGKPITDDSLKQAFEAELGQMGIPPQETVAYMGDLRVDVLSPFDVLFDPTAKNYEDAKYAFCNHYLDPDEIEQKWNVRLSPDAIPASPEVSLPFDNSASSAGKTVRKVTIGYFKPGSILPNGRYVVWSGNQILEDGPWQYPTNELPIVKFHGLRIPGSLYGTSVVEHAIPLQKELNRTLSQIVEYKNLTLKPRYWAPVGSIERTRITTEPGSINVYNPTLNNQKPEPESLPGMPNYVFEHLGNINDRLNDMFAMKEVTEGTTPPNVEAGIAIDLLQEMASDRVAPMIQDNETAISKAGNLMLGLAQQYYIEPRLMKIKGSGGSTQVRKFTQADLAGEIDVYVEAGSGLPRTRAGRQARIESFIGMGLIQPDQAWKHLDMADLKSISQKFQADEDSAYREHDKLNEGQPINLESIQQAAQMIQQGLDPNTQQPLDPNANPEELLQQAGNQPHFFDNHQVHLDIHGSFMKSAEYEGLPDNIRKNYLDHYMAHYQTVLSLPDPQGDKPKVSLQLKSAVGPHVQSEILKSAGVVADPATSAEPPIDTWVTDSKDKPDVDSAPSGDANIDMQNQQQDHELGVKLWDAILKSYLAQQTHNNKLDQQKAMPSKGTPNPKKGISMK